MDNKYHGSVFDKEIPWIIKISRVIMAGVILLIGAIGYSIFVM